MTRTILPLLLLVFTAFALAACGPYGQVEQGRAVAYDSTTKPTATITIIGDSNTVEGKPAMYDKLPAQVFLAPEDPNEMGAVPVVGLQLKLDRENKIITMYNPATQKLDHLGFELVDKQDSVSVRRQHPLVYDAATGKERKFPQVNADEKTVTLYDRAKEQYTVIKLADEDFAKYKEEDWGTGDEVRIYYKEAGKSLRFMNVTKTDFSKRK